MSHRHRSKQSSLGMTVALVAALLCLCAIPASAAPMSRRDSSGLTESDPAVTPADLSASGADAYEPDNTRATARLMQIGSAPEDHTLNSARDEDWYHIMVSDGPGYLRIGATGAFGFDEYGENGEKAASGRDDAPRPGAKLAEQVLILPYEHWKGHRQKSYYIRISNVGNGPIVYRLSAISELPAFDMGALSAELASEDYITAVAEGDLRTVLNMTRSQTTTEQVTGLRENLFNRTEPLWLDAVVHYPVSHNMVRDAGRYENSPIQRVIWTSSEAGTAYALEVK